MSFEAYFRTVGAGEAIRWKKVRPVSEQEIHATQKFRDFSSGGVECLEQTQIIGLPFVPVIDFGFHEF